jgi:5-oxoprolinase (ATP-hydrolysing)
MGSVTPDPVDPEPPAVADPGGGDGWQFWIDRGGTFTDVVGRRPDGTIVTGKLLSDNPRHYHDAATTGIRRLLDLADDAPLPPGSIRSVKMGTTVATNALLERRGEPTVLVVTAGFADALRIGYQIRPDLFALDIALPEMLHKEVIEVDERIDAEGKVLRPLDLDRARRELADAHDRGLRSVAIVLLHGYRHHQHEALLARAARAVGFPQVSVSHEVSPLLKLISRGDTTVVDAYLSPVLRRYVDRVERRLAPDRPGAAPPSLMFMQSNGGLTDAHRFRGKDALLSGPAGGVVGMVATATSAGHHRLIGFDMGGTSTDVSHYAGELERTRESEVAGVRVRSPMMQIHTVAAGGGSICHFDGARMRVGPDSAGADPGPVCYGNGGPLTITDCNVALGRLRPEFFPAVFGPTADEPLDTATTATRFGLLADEVTAATGSPTAVADVAEGFLSIAVDNMANAIRKISVQRGHDVTAYTLMCFGGAGGQHACGVADRLGMTRVLIHPHAGVLSALGIGLADVRTVADEAIEADLGSEALELASGVTARLEAEGRAAIAAQGVAPDRIAAFARVALRYHGSDTALQVALGSATELLERFEVAHRARFGFVTDKPLIVESVQVEVVGRSEATVTGRVGEGDPDRSLLGHRSVTFNGRGHGTPFHDRRFLGRSSVIDGPAVIVEANSTTVVEPGWRATVDGEANLVLARVMAFDDRPDLDADRPDPVQLEIFNNLFMNVAEQMGVVLENTASSVNIKERLDFSCAIFDPDGELVANAPHMPVHLGSMSESIKSVIAGTPSMAPGDVFVLNAPYNGGTHLPDVTVIKPVLSPGSGAGTILFYVAARGHHADIGGTTPGSMPAGSTTVIEEGVLLDNIKLVDAGRFRDTEIRAVLAAGPHPARNPDQNLADLEAQVAACEKGATELIAVIDHYGLDVVHAYMGHVRRNAERSVRRLIGSLGNSSFTSRTDDGHQVSVTITVDHETRSATIDFTGTSGVHPGNFNAPTAVCRAAVLYVFRCLVDDDIPLNAGCMAPLEVVIPSPSMISPAYPAAVLAGNVETSQLIVDTLLGALGAAAASQGTMNNISWGNDRHQYYETICGGAGATPRADGCDAVHTHMTNSRLTDPEVLEWRHPVLLESFTIRRGSGGAGANRGGDGTVRRIRFREPMTVNVLSSHRVVPPYGVAGGRPGAVGANRVIRVDGAVDHLAGVDQCQVGPGDVVEIATPGGGGWGPPPIGTEQQW